MKRLRLVGGRPPSPTRDPPPQPEPAGGRPTSLVGITSRMLSVQTDIEQERLNQWVLLYQYLAEAECCAEAGEDWNAVLELEAAADIEYYLTGEATVTGAALDQLEPEQAAILRKGRWWTVGRVAVAFLRVAVVLCALGATGTYLGSASLGWKLAPGPVATLAIGALLARGCGLEMRQLALWWPRKGKL